MPNHLGVDALAAVSILAVALVAIISLAVTAPRRRRRHQPAPEPAAPAGSPFAPTTDGLVPSPVERPPTAETSWRPARVQPKRPQVSFSDVAGLDHAIEELREVADYLSDPQRFRALGADLPRGILLYGPPGCGKTLLARALAGETGVPFFSISAASFVEQYVGLGAARVRQLFESASKHPASIIFIDELDAVGRSRNDSTAGGVEFDHTLNQLLVELDGFAGSSGALILAATNRPELLDPALQRPGRFDRRVKIEPPDCDGRQRVLELHARRRPFSETVDWSRVARQTAGLTPAELANVVNEAALLAGRRHRTVISDADVAEACTRQLSGTSASFLVEEETRWLLSVHEAGHAVLSQLLRGVQPPARVSILGGADAYDRSVWETGEAREVLTKRELTARLILLLGGRAAELNVLGEPSTQAEDDLARAAAMARRMVERWAMTGRFDLAGQPAGRAHVPAIAGGDEVRRLIAGAENTARAILGDNRTSLVRVARALSEREALTSEEVAGLVGPVITATRPTAPPTTRPAGRTDPPRFGPSAVLPAPVPAPQPVA